MSIDDVDIPEGWRSSSLANGWFQIVHPSTWDVEHGESFSTIEDPEGVASIGVVLALRPSSNLTEFAEVCWRVPPPFQSVHEPVAVSAAGWMEGVFQDFLDPTASDPDDTTRRVVCIRSNDLYGKVTFYCHRRWLDTEDYARVEASIQLEGMRVVGAP